MKKYIKPQTEVIAVEAACAMMQASGDFDEVAVTPGETNDRDRAKWHTFDVWDIDDDE